jgi:hypothetical protein
LGAIAARFIFSLALPWIVTTNHIRGLFSTKPLINPQNEIATAEKGSTRI